MKVLHVLPQINKGGTEMAILNLKNNIDSSKVTFDFLVESAGDFDSAFSRTSTIHIVPNRNKKDYLQSLIAFFNSHDEYQIIHTHTSPHMGLVLDAAKRAGVAGRIAHSHNARNDIHVAFRKLKIFKSRRLERSANYFLACSQDAAKWLFPTRHASSIILRNAVDHSLYAFNARNRRKYRRKLGILDDEFAVVMIARLSREKNHSFAFEVIDLARRSSKTIKLFLIGDGPLKEVLKEEIRARDLNNTITILGHIADVDNYLSAFDVSILPSRAEGLGLVLIESQINGMNCLASVSVPREADIGKLKRLRLEKHEWSDNILEMQSNFTIFNRSTMAPGANGYDIKSEVKALETLYEDIYDGADSRHPRTYN